MALVRLALDGGGERRIFEYSVIILATARGFANCFCLGHLWDVLLWSRRSRVTVSHRQVAHGGGVEGVARERTGTSEGLTTPLVSRLPMAASCAFFAQTLSCGLSYVLTQRHLSDWSTRSLALCTSYSRLRDRSRLKTVPVLEKEFDAHDSFGKLPRATMQTTNSKGKRTKAQCVG